MNSITGLRRGDSLISFPAKLLSWNGLHPPVLFPLAKWEIQGILNAVSLLELLC